LERWILSVSSSSSGYATASINTSTGVITVTRKSLDAFSGVTITVSVTPDGNHTAPSNKSFTVSGAGISNGHAYVDLGNPSCYYATMNVGASSEGGDGYYFAWGETSPKSNYTSANYTGSKISSNLSASQDAARQNWGGTWRLPTKAEFQWLLDNCTWTWTSSGGRYGFRLYSKINGYTSKSIFMPASGYKCDGAYQAVNGIGDYQTSSWSGSYPWQLGFNDTGARSFYTTGAYRYWGFSVRAVLSK
jgi:hypothetical protein